jgi:hypothetical protein
VAAIDRGKVHAALFGFGVHLCLIVTGLQLLFFLVPALDYVNFKVGYCLLV